jgi:hypothetical protein
MNGDEEGDGTGIGPNKKWADEGRRLLQVKAEWRAAGKTFANAAPFAYQSLPVDISIDGRYLLQFGPLDSEFDYPKSPTAVVYDFPADIKFVVVPTGKTRTATSSGKRYFEAEVSVTDLKHPYHGMTAWIY